VDVVTGINNLAPDERFDAVRPYQGRLCDVTYRSGSVAQWRTERFRVIGAAWHATNGNSTGDLIVAPADPDNIYVIDGVRAPMKSIGLANLRAIAVVGSWV
jgi:hypothetical protein